MVVDRKIVAEALKQASKRIKHGDYIGQLKILNYTAFLHQLSQIAWYKGKTKKEIKKMHTDLASAIDKIK